MKLNFKKTWMQVFGISTAAFFSLYLNAQESIPYRWQNVVIGGGGFVTGIITSESEKGLIYCKTDVGGAYRWDTLNKAWIPINDDLTAANSGLQGIESVALDPTDPSKVYLAAGEYMQWSESAMLISSNKGDTWQKTSVPFKCGGNDYGRSVDERLVVDPNLPSLLYMGSRVAGMYKSTNNAASWTKVAGFPVTKNPSNTGISFIKFIKSSGEKGKPTPLIFAGVARRGGDNFYVSRDSGTTWLPVPNHNKNLMPVHAAVAADSLLYIAYSDTSGPYATSKGAVVKYSINTGIFTDVTPLQKTSAFSGISVFPSNPNIIYVSTISGWPDQIYRTSDGGATWKDISTGATKVDIPYTEFHWVCDVEVDPFDSDHVMFVTGYGIWSTYDASNIDKGAKVNWYFTNKGLEETVVQGIVSPSFGAPLISVIGDYTGFRHVDLDKSAFPQMLKPAIGSSNALAVAANKPNMLARAGKTAYYSIDNGIKWTAFKTLPTTGAIQGKMAISADGSTIVWTPENMSTYYTRDKGLTWNECGGVSATNLRALADGVNDKYFYIYDKTGSILVSSDGAETFTKGASVIANGGEIAAALGKEGNVWLPAKGLGLYFSEDHGSSFTKIAAVQSAEAVATGIPFPNQEYPCVYIIGKINNVYGFFRSDDKGATWKRVNNNKQNFGGVNLIAADAQVPGRFYVTSTYNGRGILYGVPMTDCHGDSAGTAYYDACGVCAGGKTGIEPCKKDCSGEVNGTAAVDKCGVCSGGNTGVNVDACLSAVNSASANDFITLTPNPFSDVTMLNSNKKVSYEIFNVFGSKLEQGFCEGSYVIGKTLENGVYFLSVSDGSQMQVSKIIKK